MKFSIYSPVFNGAKCIHRVHKSLANQTFRDFEWLIINDASTDNSSEVIKELIKSCDFPVNFVDLEKNIGFNRSLNLALEKANGEFFLIAHADDEFVPDALQAMTEAWDTLPAEVQKTLQGVKCNCNDQYGNLIGDLCPQDYWVADIFDLLYKYKVRGEKWGFIKTELRREFPFPEEEKFVPESVIWHRMYYKYKALFINRSLRIYYVDDDVNSLSQTTKARSKFSKGKRMLPLDYINYYFPRVGYNPKIMLVNLMVYWQFTFLSGIGISKGLKDIINPGMRLLAFFFILPGYLLSKRK